MKITILTPGPGEEEEIIVKVNELSEEAMSLIKQLKAGKSTDTIAAYTGDNIVMLALRDIFYFDAVDNRVFAYTRDKCYEVKKKLFELEEDLQSTSFIRISKSAIVNIKQIERLVPEFNGRFEACLKNKESIIISRGYMPGLKQKLGVGKQV